MSFYQRALSSSIVRALNPDPDQKSSYLSRTTSFFSLFSLPLVRYEAAAFQELRSLIWHFDESRYLDAFQIAKDWRLQPVGDLGYSGSTFFTTPNSTYLIKSLPRHFEYAFFQHELLPHYRNYMCSHPSSLLVRITDLLHAPPFSSLGGAFGLAPCHHIIMENLLASPPPPGPTTTPAKDNPNWETYDLKPSTYFFPERDLFGGKLTSDKTKERLIDEFPDKIRLRRKDHMTLTSFLESDTQFLQENNVVDYSLFLVRGPIPSSFRSDSANDPPTWRSGMPSSDGKWLYKAIILDFFWSKHHLQPKATTGLVNLFNIFGSKGPMSITTNPVEYRGRFLKMVEDMCEVEGEES